MYFNWSIIQKLISPELQTAPHLTVTQDLKKKKKWQY